MARLANQMKQLYAMCATALVMGRADLDGADDVGFDIELPIFTVGQTAELANIHPQTLRQYDRLGLVRPQRTDGGARRYCLRDIARLTRAQRLSQDEGINLSGIARILVLEEENRQLRREVKRMQTGDQESVFAAGRDGNIVEIQRSNRARLWRNAIRRETRELPGRDTAADIAAGATGDSNGTDGNPDDITGAEVVPTPENLNGTYDGTTVTFTWTNPQPKDGDMYAWSPVQGNSATSGPSTSTNIVADRKVELHDVTDKQTCIEVKIVRSDKQMSQNPAIACAVRQ